MGGHEGTWEVEGEIQVDGIIIGEVTHTVIHMIV